jgi:hypothetical protein
MDVRMIPQVLSPGVQDGEDRGAAPEVTGIGGEACTSPHCGSHVWVGICRIPGALGGLVVSGYGRIPGMEFTPGGLGRWDLCG